MKFKNSYILLITMAIFLLVSIGSVCASEDITSDDSALASSDADVVLADDGDDTTTPADGETTQEKTNTTITATSDKEKFEYGELEKNITVDVKDNESNPISELNKDNFTVKKGKDPIQFSYDNSKISILEKLPVGSHNLTIAYLGNTNYNQSTTYVILKIFGNKTIEDVPSVVDTSGTTVEIPVRLTDGIDNYTEGLNSSNTNITDGNNLITDWTFNGTHIIINNINAPVTLTINYTDGASNIKKVLVKCKTTTVITPTVIEITEGENATFNIKVIGADGNPLNITMDNLTFTGITLSNYNFNKTVGNLTVTGLKKGVYNVTVTYKGNNVNNTSKSTILINVRGATEINTNVNSINVNSTKKGEIKIINITDGVDKLDYTKENLNITYKIGNETFNVDFEIDENGTLKFTLPNGNFTTATLIIDYKNGNSTKNITLNRIYNAKIEIINAENDYLCGNFTFKLVDIDDPETIIADKTVTIKTEKSFTKTIGTITSSNPISLSVKSDSKGILNFKNSYLRPYFYSAEGNSWTIVPGDNLDIGSYNITLESTEVKFDKFKTEIVINKLTPKITIDEFKEYYGTDKKVKITVTNAKDGEAVPGMILHLYMPQTSGKDYYFQTNANGISEIAVNSLVSGTYDITVSNNDTKNINNTEVKGKITILQKPVVINAKDVTIYYNTGTTATIKITDKATGKAVAGAVVLVQIDGKSKKTYLFQTDSNGKISFADSLDVGKHKMTVATADSRYDGGSVTKTITVKKASAKITAKKVTAYYKGGKYFTVKLTNSKNKKPIYAAKINIKIYVSKNRYYNYNGNTGMNGQIKLSLDTLKPGTYKVVVSGADSKNFKASKVTTKIVVKKAPTKFVIQKTAKKSKKYLKITVKNKKTKKVISGIKIKVKVYTGKKSKTYTLKTSSKGIAKLNINKIKVGKHKVVVTSANKYCVAKQTKATVKIKK